jgi:hypothetical protein
MMTVTHNRLHKAYRLLLSLARCLSASSTCRGVGKMGSRREREGVNLQLVPLRLLVQRLESLAVGLLLVLRVGLTAMIKGRRG